MDTQLKDDSTLEIEHPHSMRNVYLLTFSMFTFAVGYTMVIPFLPVYLLELGVKQSALPMWSGVIFSITFLIAGIMAPIWGSIADKKGRKMMLLRAGFALSFCYFLGGFATNAWFLLGVRALMGFSNGFLPAAMTLVTISVPKKKVGSAIATFQIGLICGNILGPLAGGITEHYLGMRPAFWVVGIANFFITLLVAKYVVEPLKIKNTEDEHAPKGLSGLVESVKEAKKNKSLVEILALYFVLQGVILMLQPEISIYVGHLLGSMSDAAFVSGFILSAGGVAGAIMARIWARFGQRNGYFKSIYIALCGAGLSVMLQGLIPNIWAFGLLQVCVGIFAVGINPSLSAAVTLFTKPEERGRAYGLVASAQQFGGMAGPLIASGLLMFIDMHQVFIITGICLFFIAYYVFKTHRSGY